MKNGVIVITPKVINKLAGVTWAGTEGSTESLPTPSTDRAQAP